MLNCYEKRIIGAIVKIIVLKKNNEFVITEMGTGFIVFIEDQNNRIPIILTNKHIFEITSGHTALEKVDIFFDGIFTSLKVKSIHLGKPNNSIIYHPNPEIDLAAILIDEGQIKREQLEAYSFEENMIITDADEEKVTIGDNVLLIGYMLGIHSVTSNLPPYTRKGSIATTYIQDVPLKSDFVIDIYSGYGMSGSPIILDGDHLKLLGIQKQAYNADAFGSVSMKTGDKILDVNDIRACTRIPIHTAVGIKANEISDLKLVVLKRHRKK